MSFVHGLNFAWINDKNDFVERTKAIRLDALRVYERVATETIASIQGIAQDIAQLELRMATEVNILKFYHSVHPDAEIRDASAAADLELSALAIDLSMRKDVFDQFQKLSEMCEGKLPQQYQRYVDRKIKIGKHNGLHCEESVRKEVELISKELSKLKIEFERNLSEENTILEFSEEELEGCPPLLINSLEKSETDPNKRKVSLKYPHYFPISKMALLPETRRQMEFAFNSRCKEKNGPLLKSMMELRAKKAKLLGFSTHADYVLSMRMAKDSKTVWNFLQELRLKLLSKKEEELSKLIDYKKQLYEEKGFEFNDRLDAWDFRYFINICEEKDFFVNHEKLSEYFPLETVQKGMFEIYEKLLSLKFSKIEVNLWHPDVTLFSVNDSIDNNLLGYFFIDLHPRVGKYGHARVSHLQPGGLIVSAKGEPVRQVTAAAMLANFTKPTDERPALLNHDEVVTFFHEFGHLMHVICSQVDFEFLNPFNVERDFVECPSQMLENWCWKEESLKMMSGHYKTNEPIDPVLMENLIKSRIANVAVLNTRQICLGSFDQIIHTNPNEDPAKVYADITKEYLGISVSEGSNMPATFNHMAGDYDAQYYGYLWSEVFAADIFKSRFEKEGLLNPKTGKDYRDLILKPGNTKDAIDMIQDFLGRPPNKEAFLSLMGLSS